MLARSIEYLFAKIESQAPVVDSRELQRGAICRIEREKWLGQGTVLRGNGGTVWRCRAVWLAEHIPSIRQSRPGMCFVGWVTGRPQGVGDGGELH